MMAYALIWHVEGVNMLLPGGARPEYISILDLGGQKPDHRPLYYTGGGLFS